MTHPSLARYAFHGDMDAWWLPMRFGSPPTRYRGMNVVIMLIAQSNNDIRSAWEVLSLRRAICARMMPAAA